MHTHLATRQLLTGGVGRERGGNFSLGLPVVGTLGVLLAAKRKGLIVELRPLLDQLLHQGFWVAPRLVKQALLTAGEGGDP